MLRGTRERGISQVLIDSSDEMIPLLTEDCPLQRVVKLVLTSQNVIFSANQAVYPVAEVNL